MTIQMADLLNAPLPLRVAYTGERKVKRALRKLTITGWKDLHIGFLSEDGSKAAVMEDGSMVWILDVALNYEVTPSEDDLR